MHFGVMGDGHSEETLPMQYFLDRERKEEKHAFFPPGEYAINANILVHGKTNIHGSVKGITVLKTLPGKFLRISIGNTLQNGFNFRSL